ncbi:MAG: hypothetical protein ACRBBW_20785 [Cellvibrionaceae bacterium]
MIKGFLVTAIITFISVQQAIANGATNLSPNASAGLSGRGSEAINIGVYDTRPIAWKASSGKIEGVAPYLARRLIQGWRADTKLQFKLESTERMIQELLRGQADIIYTIADPRLEAEAIKLKFITRVPLTLWSLADHPIRELGDIKGANIATLPMYTELPYLRDARITQLPVSKDFLRLLQGRRVEGITAFQPILELLASDEAISSQQYHQLHIADFDIFLWLSRKSWLAKHEQALRRVANRENSPEILAEYLQRVTSSKSSVCDASAQPVLSSRVTRCH